MIKDKKINVRVDSELLQFLSKALGVDESKAIRASMNCCKNVLQSFFGGEVSNIFKRKINNEEIPRYEERL